MQYIIILCSLVFDIVSEHIRFSRFFCQILQACINAAEIRLFLHLHFTEVRFCGEVESNEEVRL